MINCELHLAQASQGRGLGKSLTHQEAIEDHLGNTLQFIPQERTLSLLFLQLLRALCELGSKGLYLVSLGYEL